MPGGTFNPPDSNGNALAAPFRTAARKSVSTMAHKSRANHGKLVSLTADFSPRFEA